MDILSLTTTVGSEADAQRLARALVQARLAACVQVDAPVRSHYRWDARLCEEVEVRLTIKSLPAVRERLLAFLRQHHPYEVPQLLWQEMAASEAYAGWVRSEVDG